MSKYHTEIGLSGVFASFLSFLFGVSFPFLSRTLLQAKRKATRGSAGSVRGRYRIEKKKKRGAHGWTRRVSR